MPTQKNTISAGGVIIQNMNIAMVSQHGTSWSLPKGHIDQNETPIQAAYREIFEETGLTELQFIQALPTYSRYKIGIDTVNDDTSELKQLYFFLFKTTASTLQSRDADNPDAEWVPIEEVEKRLTHPQDKAFFKSIKSTIYATLYPCIKVETTFSSRESADNMASKLIELNLAACCHIFPVESCYTWNKSITQDSEYCLSIKTQERHFHALETYINKYHIYECPQLIATPITHISANYMTWILSETHQSNLAN